ncbi:protein kinase [Streptomyces sp. CG1]|uniref:protein kinase domain-containing protein n=1 Tax=Streptomyces sp. CG1 TaxID=1287523 RepID=UPI0034E282D2
MQAGAVLDGRYRPIKPIAAGGFGQVWQAHDPKIDRLVAVKVLSEDGSADSDQQVARFAREAAAVGGLSHPHIVTVHDFGSATHDGQLYAYLVMELPQGEPRNVVLEGGRLPLPELVRTAACVADALGTAHEAGLTHRDIKPSNIIIRPNSEATVVDFGITKSSDVRDDHRATALRWDFLAPDPSGPPGRPDDAGAGAQAQRRLADGAQGPDSACPEPRKPLPPRPSALDPHEAVIDGILRADLDAPPRKKRTRSRGSSTGWSRSTARMCRIRGQALFRRPEAADRGGGGKAPIEAFVPQTHPPGMEAEVDFGDVAVGLAGELVTCYLFSFRLSYSSKGRPSGVRFCRPGSLLRRLRARAAGAGRGPYYRLASTRARAEEPAKAG